MVFEILDRRVEHNISSCPDYRDNETSSLPGSLSLPSEKTIVVIGATGHFGTRICRRLIDEDNLTLVVASRSLRLAESLALELADERAAAVIQAASIDQTASQFESDLAGLSPDLVVHTAGPYQGQDYRVAECCIAIGCHYVDLADGRDFVDGFGVLNKIDGCGKVLLVTGASTLPGLSSAVVASLRDRFADIHEIETTIAPAHQTPRGLGTIRAVLSYCGRPFQVLADGQWVTRYGWQNLKWQNYPELGMRLSGACDVPDLSLMPERMPGLKTVSFQAALEAKWEQVGLWMMAWLSRAGLVSDWSRYASAFSGWSSRLINLGSDRGGMHVRVSGTDVEGKPRVITWFLTAENNHGPEIPCSPALIIARKLLRGQLTLRGAHACYGLFSMGDFDREVAGLDISWKTVE